MIFDRRQAAQLLLATGTAALTAPRAFAKTSESVDGVTRAHGTSLLGELKYGADFKHYDYVNPDAPKGGKVQLAVQGAFDSFNPFIVKGNPVIHGWPSSCATGPISTMESQSRQRM